jgi:hypothetical protein
MNVSLQSPTSWFYSGLLVVSLLITPVRVRAADPMETICAAFRASSEVLHSGIEKGKYRDYMADRGGEWQPLYEADIVAQFEGRNYRVDFSFETNDRQRMHSRRMFYDGEKLMVASFTPDAPPTGAYVREKNPLEYGEGRGLARGAYLDFQWDVTNLAKNAWDPERVAQNLHANPVEIKETPDGDLAGSYQLTSTDRTRVYFECPRRYGYNLAKKQVFKEGEDRRDQEYSLQWRQGPKG